MMTGAYGLMGGIELTNVKWDVSWLLRFMEIHPSVAGMIKFV